MDNASIYHSSIKILLFIFNINVNFLWGVKELCAGYEVRVEYLPPYSPDYNPIEEFFSVVKHWLKKYYEEYGEELGFDDFLQMVIEQCSFVNIAKAYYKYAGYYI